MAKRYLYLFSFGFYEAAVLLCNVEPDRYAEALLSMPRLLAVSAKVPESAMPGLHDKLNAVLGEIMFEYAVTEEFRIGRDNNAKRAEVMSRIEAERRDDDMRRERRRSIAEVEEARLAPLKEAARALLRKTFRYLLKESHSDRSRKDDANERFIFYKEAETELDRIFRSKDMIEFLPYEDEDGEIPF